MTRTQPASTTLLKVWLLLLLSHRHCPHCPLPPKIHRSLVVLARAVTAVVQQRAWVAPHESASACPSTLVVHNVFGGTYSYGGGSLDTMAARGGFVFKLGKIDDSLKVQAKKAAKLHDLVSNVQQENQSIRAENQQLKDLLAQQSTLLAATQERLERLEQVAGISLSPLGDRASR